MLMEAVPSQQLQPRGPPVMPRKRSNSKCITHDTTMPGDRAEVLQLRKGIVIVDSFDCPQEIEYKEASFWSALAPYTMCMYIYMYVPHGVFRACCSYRCVIILPQAKSAQCMASGENCTWWSSTMSRS